MTYLPYPVNPINPVLIYKLLKFNVFFSLCASVYPVGPEDRTGAYLTGAPPGKFNRAFIQSSNMLWPTAFTETAPTLSRR
jgi:hypothetical protein